MNKTFNSQNLGILILTITFPDIRSTSSTPCLQDSLAPISWMIERFKKWLKISQAYIRNRNRNLMMIWCQFIVCKDDSFQVSLKWKDLILEHALLASKDISMDLKTPAYQWPSKNYEKWIKREPKLSLKTWKRNGMRNFMKINIWDRSIKAVIWIPLTYLN